MTCAEVKKAKFEDPTTWIFYLLKKDGTYDLDLFFKLGHRSYKLQFATFCTLFLFFLKVNDKKWCINVAYVK